MTIKTIEEETYSKSTDWYDYKDTVTIEGNNLHFKVALSPKATEVPADKIAQYQKDIEAVHARSMSQFSIKREKSDIEIYLLIAAMIGMLIAFEHISFPAFTAGCAVIAIVAIRENIANWFK